MPKTLYLMRHAKSSWSVMSQNDMARPLNERGLRDTPEMGRRLRGRNVRPDIILCSPAQRTRQTADLISQEMDLDPGTLQFNDPIYEASTDTLLQLIRSLPDQCQSAMIIGHNPSIGWLANALSDVGLERMPTCAIATLEMDTNRWAEVGTCTSSLLDFDYPKK